MNADFECPACNAKDWQRIESFEFCRRDHQRSAAGTMPMLLRKLRIAARRLLLSRPQLRTVSCRHLTTYQLQRRRVLFETWFPQADVVELQTVFCRRCGFASITPRPEDADISRKYEHLQILDPDIGGQVKSDRRAALLDERRAERVYQLVAPSLGEGKARVLDYGGGNGKLLMPFLAHGHHGFLVDYSRRMLPGVVKIGNDVSDLPESVRFECIICSHVLEHVSDLGRLLKRLRQSLAESGVVYVEVPQQIWAGIRIEADPVTHINFFTRGSLQHLLKRHGFELLQGQQEILTYGRNAVEVIWLLARSASVPQSLPEPACDIDSLLHPPRLLSLRKFMRLNVLPKLYFRSSAGR